MLIIDFIPHVSLTQFSELELMAYLYYLTFYIRIDKIKKINFLFCLILIIK